MRITVLGNAFEPRVTGGAARIAATQVRLLQRAGHEVRVWDVQPGWFGASVLKRLFYHFLDLFPNVSIVREIVAWEPDFLMTHNLTGAGFATPKRIRLLSDVEWIHVLHDVQLFEPSGQLVSDKTFTVWQRFWSLLRRWSLGEPDQVISPTSWLLRVHRRRGFFQEADAEIVPNPGLVSRSRKRVRERYQDPLRVVFIGGFHQGKGAHLLPQLISDGVQLACIGEGPLLARTQEQLPYARFLGRLNTEQISVELLQADVLILPSTVCENQPTVILEAFACGLPVVAFDVGGVRETVQTGGYVVPVGRIDLFQEALESLREPMAWKRVSEQAALMAKRYEPDQWIEALVDNLKR